MADTALARLIYRHPVRLARMAGYDRLVEPLHDGWIRELAFGRGDLTLQAHRGAYKTTCLKSTDLACNVSGTPQLSGYGIGGSVTGKHYDRVFTDDVVTLRDRASRAERERTKAFYRELQNIKNRGGRIVNTGTPWHKEDAFALMPEPERYTPADTGLITPDELRALKASMTRSLYAANYELRHVADEGAVFKGEPGEFFDPALLRDGYMHVDAAYGGSDGTAVTCVQWHDGAPYVHGMLWPETHVDRCMDAICEMHKRLMLGTVHMERNADKGYLAEQFRQRGLPVQTYQETQNKHIKITTHARGAWPRLKKLDDGSDASAAYWAEVMDYTDAAPHDDAPDSLACAIRLRGKAVKVHLFKGGI